MSHEIQIGFWHKTLLLDRILEVKQKNKIFSKCGTSRLALKIVYRTSILFQTRQYKNNNVQNDF